MPFNYTIAQGITDAESATGVTASVITEILGDASKKSSHASAHMKSETSLSVPRVVTTEAASQSVGQVHAVDGHLAKKYSKRKDHAMFDTALSSVEAIAAAINCPLGVIALRDLLGLSDDDGVDIHSRTATKIFAGTKQYERKTNKSGTTSRMAEMDAEYVVVCLRREKGGVLMIASAYPVKSTAKHKLKRAGMDWCVRLKDESLIKELPITAKPVVTW